jgi:uncharacterized protein with gpF-like domain
MIARTETAGAVNRGSYIYYENQGVKFKKWSTASDELVRESHTACQQEGAIPFDAEFVNGLKCPNDENGEAGEVINCRCRLVPITEGEL